MRPAEFTNVLSHRFGEGAVDGIGAELGDFVVATTPVPWTLTRGRLGGDPRAVLFADSMEQAVLDRQVQSAPPCDAVVAIGGGCSIDLGKYLAWKRRCRLVTIPTALSADALVTPAAAVRVQGRIEYLGQTSPDPLVVDYDLLRQSPPELNVAGVGDLLSIHTATFDWELAEQAKRSEFPFSWEAVQTARGILAEVMARASDIRACTNEGLQALVDGYLGVNSICLPAGHYRVEEGSEHYLFYALEENLRRTFIHGHIIGLGVYLMARLQENRPQEITRFLDEVGLCYHPAAVSLSQAQLEAGLLGLRLYVEIRKDFYYTVVQDRPITPQWIRAACDALQFS